MGIMMMEKNRIDKLFVFAGGWWWEICRLQRAALSIAWDHTFLVVRFEMGQLRALLRF
jgi:hypothetical protein